MHITLDRASCTIVAVCTCGWRALADNSVSAWRMAHQHCVMAHEADPIVTTTRNNLSQSHIRVENDVVASKYCNRQSYVVAA